jgi:hypothetical protein
MKTKRVTNFAPRARAALSAAALATAATAAPSEVQARIGNDGNAALAERILALHNRERAQVGAPPLAWDESLAAAAAAYAPELARLGRLTHSLRSTRRGQGENLWRGTGGTFEVEAVIASWASEKRLFRPGTFPAISTTGASNDVNHYSQMIWGTTTHVGCAFRRGGRWDLMVCRYSPRGNVDGQRVP